jgi:MFS family permease
LNNRLTTSIKRFLRLPPDADVSPQVRKHFRHNFTTNVLDGAIFLLGESFVSISTILPVFASTLTDSAILIGLVPAVIQAGWFIPQLFTAEKVKSLKQLMPFTKAMALVERLPYLVLPLTAFLIHWLSKEMMIWFFIFIVIFRGLASGFVALPWQEVIAIVIPSVARSRFFGVSRLMGQILSLLGAALTGLILADVPYPDNYGISFVLGGIFIWVSFFFFIRTVEPRFNELELSSSEEDADSLRLNLAAFIRVIREDQNFRRYLISRIVFQLGSMASGFYAVYGIKAFAQPDQQAAVFSALIFIASIIGNSLWSVVGDRFGARNILIVSDSLHLLALLIAFLAPGIWIYYTVFAIIGFCQTGWVIGDMILGMEIGAESERPIYMGLARTVPGVVVLIAPVIGGGLVEWLGYRSMFLTALVLSLVGVFYLLQVRVKPAN